MKRRLLSILLAVGAFGLGYLGSELIGHPIPDGTTPALPESPTPVAPEPAPETAGPAPEVPSVDPVENRWETYFASLPAVETGEARWRLTGTVRTEKGQPLAGVQVRLKPSGMPAGFDYSEVRHDTLAEYIAKRTAQHRYYAALAGARETDAGGRFAFENIPFNGYKLVIERPGYEFVTHVRGTEQVWFRPDADIQVTATRSVAIPVRVHEPDGSPATGVEVEWITREGRASRRAWTPTDATLTVPEGLYTLTASRGESFTSDSRTVLAALGEVSPVTLTLRSRAGLQVHVEAPPGEVAENGHCLLWMPWVRGTAPDPDRLMAGGASLQCYGSEDQTIRNLPPGLYLVGVERSPGEVAVLEMAEVEEGLTPVTLTLPPVAASEGIVVWIEAPTVVDRGSPSLSLHLMGPGDRDMLEMRRMKRDDGSILLLPDPRAWSVLDGRAPGELWLHVRLGELGQMRVPVTTPVVTVSFRPPAILTVDLPVPPVDGEVSVSLEPVDDPDPFLSSADGTEKDGTFRFDPVQPGSYVLVAMLDMNSGITQTLARIPVELHSGEQRRAIEMPELHRLQIDVDASPEVGWAVVGLFPLDLDRRDVHWTAAPTGSAVIHLRSGDYHAILGGTDGLSVMKLRVTSDRTVRFAGEPMDALTVKPFDPGSRWAELSVQAGDQIIGHDGQDFASSSAIEAWLMGVSTQAEVSLRVLRAGEILDVTAPGPLLFQFLSAEASEALWYPDLRTDRR